MDSRGGPRNLRGAGGFQRQAGGGGAAPDEGALRLLAFQAGDAAAFEALFQRWSAPLLRYLERMVRDAASAEELVQETFLRVYRARQRYAPEARFSTWIYRIATN